MKVRSCPVSNSTTLIRYDVMSPFCSSRIGACHDILMLVELIGAAVMLTGGSVGALKKDTLSALCLGNCPLTRAYNSPSSGVVTMRGLLKGPVVMVTAATSVE